MDIQKKQEEKQKGLYENFMNIIEKSQKEDYILPKSMKDDDKSANIGSQMILKEVHRSTIENVMNKMEHIKCVDSV